MEEDPKKVKEATEVRAKEAKKANYLSSVEFA